MIEFTGAVNLLIVYIGLFRLTLHWKSFSCVIALFISMCMLSCNSCKFLSLQNFRRIGSEKISWISLPIRRMHQFFTMVVFKFCNALLCARTGRILLVFFCCFFFWHQTLTGGVIIFLTAFSISSSFCALCKRTSRRDSICSDLQWRRYCYRQIDR